MRAVLVLLLLIGGLPASEADLLDHLTGHAETALAVDRALGWLREQQGEGGGFGPEQHRAAMTALVVLAHATAGITPEHPRFGAGQRAALVHLLEHQNSEGYFGERDGSRMYGHALVTLALASALDSCADDRLSERMVTALRRAVALIEQAARIDKPQPYRGGWRYQPDDKRSDVSVSVWQVQALAAVGQIGLAVSEAVLEEARAYLLRMCDDQGRVAYEKPGKHRATLRGSMLLALAASGDGQGAQAGQVLEALLDEQVAWQGPWFFMRSSAEALALCQYRPDGWRQRLAGLHTILRDQQHEDGWWPKPPGDNEGGHGRIYSVALAVIALCADRFALPVYQP